MRRGQRWGKEENREEGEEGGDEKVGRMREREQRK